MFSRFVMPIDRSVENLRASLMLNPVVMDEGVLNRFRLKAVRMTENNTFWLISPGLVFPLHPFAVARIVKTSENRCEIRGTLWQGPVFLMFLVWVYGFMLVETVKNFLKFYGTDRLAFSVGITLFAFACFIIIPWLVVRGWKQRVVTTISENLNKGN